MDNIEKVKISVTVPAENLEAVRNAICEAGAGVIGNYTYCSYSSKVVGTFRPNEKANPYIGENGKLEFVEEEKLEQIAVEYLKKHSGPAFIMMSAMNVERMITVYNVARKTGRLFLEDIYCRLSQGLAE